MSVIVRNFLFSPLLVMQALVAVTSCTESTSQTQLNAVASVELSSIRNDLDQYRLIINKNADEDLK